VLKIFHRYTSPWKLVLFFGDLVLFFGSVLGGYYYSCYKNNIPVELFGKNMLLYISMGVIYFLVLYIADIYNYQQDYRRLINLGRVFLASWCGTAVVVVFFYFFFGALMGSFMGRTILLVHGMAFALLISSWRFIFSAVSLPMRLQRRILIVGAGNAGHRLLQAIRNRPASGFQAVGFVDDNPEKIGAEVEGVPVLGHSSQLPDLINTYQIALVVVAITHEKSLNLTGNLIRISWNVCQVMDMPNFYEHLTGKVPTGDISEAWIFQWNLNRPRTYYRHFKRVFDIFWALLLLLLAWPIMILVALAIRLDSPGPILFRQNRLGQDGHIFKVTKFRTMVAQAESLGPNWTRDNDPRITKAGRIIRKMRLDELPQLFNIIIGNMSFIGPRPLAHDPMMEKISYFKYRLLVKPGITGWAQVMFPDGVKLETTNEKIKYDIYYIKNMSFALDLIIILKTIRILLLGQG